MKFFWIVIFFLISLQLFSQAKRNYLKIGLQTGQTGFLFSRAYGYDLQFELASKDENFSTIIGFGHMLGNEIIKSNIKGYSPGLNWDYDYNFVSSERVFYTEINALIGFGKNRKRLKSKLGGGLTLITNRLSYVDDVIFGIGGIISYELSKKKNNTVMVNLVLDNDLRLNDDLLLNFRFVVRKNIIKQDPLTRRVFTSQYSSSTRRSKFDYLTAMVIGLGYRF